MALQRTRTMYVTHLDKLDPKIVAACQLLEKEGLIDGTAELQRGEARPPCLHIVPTEKMENAPILDAYFTLAAASGETMVFRAENERPRGSAELARQRGFTEQEIEEHLRPWVAKRQALANAAVVEARKVLEQATLEAAAAFTDSVAGGATEGQVTLTEADRKAIDAAVDVVPDNHHPETASAE